jgi:hypothetical protein
MKSGSAVLHGSMQENEVAPVYHYTCKNLFAFFPSRLNMEWYINTLME